MTRNAPKVLGFLAVTVCAPAAFAVSSAELYTSESYGYGRVEARVQYAPGDGVVSSFFSWKDKSEQTGVFWAELDFEKLGATCYLQTNPIYGNPATNHEQKHDELMLNMCATFHTYAYEWTPEAIVWSVDGMEIRRETTAVPQAFAANAPDGMQIHFNVWPGDITFGGNFDPAILPVHEYIDWVQFSKYEGGEFKLAWREDFDGATVPAGWLTGSWASPKNKSTHMPENVNFINGYAVLSLTADNALGPAGAMPGGSGGAASGGSGSTAGAGAGGAAGANGAGGAGGSTPTAGAGGSTTSGGSTPTGTSGSPTSAAGSGAASGGATPSGGSSGNSAPTDGGCSVNGSTGSSVLGWALAAALLATGRRRRRS